MPSATLEKPPTETTTAEPVWVQSLDGATVYQAPGKDYPALAYYTEGITLTIVGRNPAGDWLVVAISPYNTGWIALNEVTSIDESQSLPRVDEPAGIETATPMPEIPISISTEFDRRKFSTTGRNDPVLNIYIKANPGVRLSIEITAPDGKIVFTETGKTNYLGIYTTSYWGALKLGGNYVITVSDEAGNTAKVNIFIDRKVNPN
jgi:hypothetical protein